MINLVIDDQKLRRGYERMCIPLMDEKYQDLINYEGLTEADLEKAFSSWLQNLVDAALETAYIYMEDGRKFQYSFDTFLNALPQQKTIEVEAEPVLDNNPGAIARNHDSSHPNY